MNISGAGFSPLSTPPLWSKDKVIAIHHINTEFIAAKL